MPGVTRSAPLDRLMRPIHQWVWGDRRSPAAKAADVRRRRDRRRTRHPARRRSDARSAAAPALSRARDRRTAPRRSVPRTRRGAAARARRRASACCSTAIRCPAAMASTTFDRRRAGSSTARLSARGGEIRRRPICDLSRAGRRRSADARDLRGDPAGRGVSHELHLHAADARLAAAPTAGTSGTRASSGCGTGICASPRPSPASIGSAVLTADVFRPAAAVRVARQARRAPRADWLDPDLARAGDASPRSQY